MARKKAPIRKKARVRKPVRKAPRRSSGRKPAVEAAGGLDAYRAKRDFDVTPEPPPEAAPGPGAERPRFMVHKHDARRLHYDLRLEMEGVLASWAVPKGPSFRPRDRRLAVQTEDHPLAYGGFEGRIPDGEYGAGDSIIWDRGTWETVPPGQASAMREKGHLLFELHGEKLRGRWHLVRTRGAEGERGEWLLFKARDEHARDDYDVVAERPESVVSGRRVTRGPVRAKARERVAGGDPMKRLLDVWPPMLATLSEPDALEDPGDWVYELKYDGYRALAGLADGRVSLQSRNGLDLASKYPEIARALEDMPVADAVLDGEIVALDTAGNASFQALQGAGAPSAGPGRRSSRKGTPAGSEAPELRYMVFDLLWLDGEDLRGRPLEERRDLLASVLANVDPPIELAERVDVPLEHALEEMRRRHVEGVIAKRRGSKYVGGRHREWLKLKVTAAQEFAIVGYSPIRTGAPAIGALHLAVWEPDARGFRYAGKVGTGFTDAVRRELWRDLERDRVEKPVAADAPRARDARWVSPRLVAQVAFTEWTGDGKIRHPSFQGLRLDKDPTECVREVPRQGVGRKPEYRTRWSSHEEQPAT